MFQKFFRLVRYTSPELKTPVVEAYHQQVIIAIMCQAAFDWTMWYFALQFAFHNAILSVAVASMIVFGVIQLDLSIVTADDSDVNVRKRWASMAWRFIFTLMIATITSVPMELKWFDSEITHRLETKQKKEIDTIRKGAMADEEKRIDTDIKDISVQLAAEASMTQGAAVADLNNYEKARSDTRQQMVTAQQQEEEKINTAIKEKEDIALAEAAGKGESGKPKCGDTCKRAEAQAQAWRDQLTQKKGEAATQLVDFDQETQDHIATLRAKRDGTTTDNQKELKGWLDTLRKERRTKVDEIRKMSPEKVSDLYGGNYQKEFGFQDRYDTLENMRTESPAVNWTIWACRVIAAIMGFLVLGMAVSAPTEVKRYYSLSAQAEVGDQSAKKVVNGMGFEDLKNLALTPKARQAFINLYAVRQQLWAVVMEVEQKLVSVVVPDERTGLYQSKHRIEGIVHALWLQKGAEVMQKLGNAEEEVRRAGQKVPVWPTDKLGQDPRGTQVWKITEQRLVSFGWESPEEVITAGKLGLKNVTTNRLELRKLIEEMEVKLQEKISANRLVDYNEVIRFQTQSFSAKIVPALHNIRASEDAIVKAHYEVPEWPAEYPDPRDGLYQRLCLMSESELREKFGWKGIVVEGPSTSAAEA